MAGTRSSLGTSVASSGLVESRPADQDIVGGHRRAPCARCRARAGIALRIQVDEQHAPAGRGRARSPRLIAVVVLPTPPFWLATARMRVRPTGAGPAGSGTPDLSQDQDSALRVAQAARRDRRHSPVLRGFGQFARGTPPLEEQASGARMHMLRGQAEQLRQGGERTGGHDIRGQPGDGLASLGVHRRP